MSVEPREILDAVYGGMYIDDEWAVRRERPASRGGRTGSGRLSAPILRSSIGRDDHEGGRGGPARPGGDQAERARAGDAAELHVRPVRPGVRPRRIPLRSRLAVSLWDGNQAGSRSCCSRPSPSRCRWSPTRVWSRSPRRSAAPSILEPHPTSGPRRRPDDMVNVSDIYVRGGAATVIAAATSPGCARRSARWRPCASGPSAGMGSTDPSGDLVHHLQPAPRPGLGAAVPALAPYRCR